MTECPNSYLNVVRQFDIVPTVRVFYLLKSLFFVPPNLPFYPILRITTFPNQLADHTFYFPSKMNRSLLQSLRL